MLPCVPLAGDIWKQAKAIFLKIEHFCQCLTWVSTSLMIFQELCQERAKLGQSIISNYASCIFLQMEVLDLA